MQAIDDDISLVPTPGLTPAGSGWLTAPLDSSAEPAVEAPEAALPGAAMFATEAPVVRELSPTQRMHGLFGSAGSAVHTATPGLDVAASSGAPLMPASLLPPPAEVCPSPTPANAFFSMPLELGPPTYGAYFQGSPALPATAMVAHAGFNGMGGGLAAAPAGQPYAVQPQAYADHPCTQAAHTLTAQEQEFSEYPAMLGLA